MKRFKMEIGGQPVIVKFSVKEKTDTVVITCIIFTDFFNANCGEKCNGITAAVSFADPHYNKSMVFVGKAKLLPGDIFSLKEGRRIAFDRAKEKFEKNITNKTDEMVKKINDNKKYLMTQLTTRFNKLNAID
jgi:hypothetical protein